MFHDSGKLNTKKYNCGKEMNRICLHCGYGYGDHLGKSCPTIVLTDEEIYIQTFVK